MATSRPDRPNVVVFFTDQQRWDTAGIHGNPMNLTPNFDRMALEGTHAYNSFTCQPVCTPARACLQTGLYATQTTCFTNSRCLPQDLRTLADCYNDAGYRTSYIGKWHLCQQEPVPRGHRGGYQDWLGANLFEFVSDAYNCVLFDEDNHAVKLPGYRVDAVTDAVIRAIDEYKDSPFFLFTSYLEPHFQNSRDDYPAPDGYAELYNDPWFPPDLRALGGSSARHLPGYYGMVKRLDEALGRILDALKSLGLSENTIVLFTSDHGCHFKTRNDEYKRSCHDSSIRVPTTIAGPGFRGGGRIQELVSIVDLPPTLLDACSIPVPSQMVGRSILPLTRGEREGWPEEVFVQISEAQVARAVRTKRWTYCVSAPDRDPRTDPDSDRYVEEALYDLRADPYTLNNLIGLTSHREAADVMRQRLIRRMAEAGEAEPAIEVAPERPAGHKKVSHEEALE